MNVLLKENELLRAENKQLRQRVQFLEAELAKVVDRRLWEELDRRTKKVWTEELWRMA